MTVFVAGHDSVVPFRVRMTSSPLTVYGPVPAGFVAKVLRLRITNVGPTGTTTYDVNIIDKTGTTFPYADDRTLTVDNFVDVDFDGHPLRPTEYLQVTSTVLNDVYVIGTALEIARTGGA